MSCSLDQQGPLMLCVTVLERRKRRTQHTWAVTSDRQMGKEWIKDILAPRQHTIISSHSHYHLVSFSLSPVPEYQWAPDRLVWPPLLLSALWVFRVPAFTLEVKCNVQEYSLPSASQGTTVQGMLLWMQLPWPWLWCQDYTLPVGPQVVHVHTLRVECETSYSVVTYPYSLTFKCMPTHVFII